MALFLSNVTLETLNVCLLIYDPSCTIGGQPWRKVAWYVILPGQTVVPDVLAVDLRTVNGWVGLYAYTASGSEEWQGSGNAWFAVDTSHGAIRNDQPIEPNLRPRELDTCEARNLLSVE